MATKTWVGAGVNELWSTAANWLPSGAPAIGDDVIFDGVAANGKKNCTFVGPTGAMASVIFLSGYSDTGIAPFNGQFTFSASLTVTTTLTLGVNTTYLTSGAVTTYTLNTGATTTLASNSKILPVNLSTSTGTLTLNGNADFQGNYTGGASPHNLKSSTGFQYDLRVGGNIILGAVITNPTDYVTIKAYGVIKTFNANSASTNQRVTFVSGSSYKNTGNSSCGGNSFYTVDVGGQFNALNNINSNTNAGTLTLSGFNTNSDFMSISGGGTYTLLNNTLIKGFVLITASGFTVTSPGAKLLLEGNLTSSGFGSTTIESLEFSGITPSIISATSTTNLQIKAISFNKTGAGSVSITSTSLILTIPTLSTYTWTHTAGTITQSNTSRISIAAANITSQLTYSESGSLTTPFTFSQLSINGGILSLNSKLRAVRLYLTTFVNTNITSSGLLGFDVAMLYFINSLSVIRTITLKSGCTYNISVDFITIIINGTLGQITLNASTVGGTRAFFNLDNNAAQSVEYVSATDIDSSGTLGVPQFTKQLIWSFNGVIAGTTINWSTGSQPPPVLPSRTVAYTFVN
jgi:hypothetical protein